MIHLSEVLHPYQDRASLMRALPNDLPSVLDASFVGLGLHEATDGPSLPPDIEADQALADCTVHRLQPVVVPVVSLDTRFPRAMGYLRSCGAESACVLPLAVGERRLGRLVAGSRSPYTYAAFDLEFLMVVARQVAMALDQAGRLDALQRAVTREREHGTAPGIELSFLVGPRGCGKTTLISIIAGLLDRTGGHLTVLGSQVDDLSPRDRVLFRRANLGFVFQQYNLLPALTAAENVAVPLLTAGVPRRRALERATAVLSQLGLEQRAGAPSNLKSDPCRPRSIEAR